MKIQILLIALAAVVAASLGGWIVVSRMLGRRLETALRDRIGRVEVRHLQERMAGIQERKHEHVAELSSRLERLQAGVEGLCVGDRSDTFRVDRIAPALEAAEEFFGAYRRHRFDFDDPELAARVEDLRDEYVSLVANFGSYPLKEPNITDRLPQKEAFDRRAREVFPELCHRVEERLRWMLGGSSG